MTDSPRDEIEALVVAAQNGDRTAMGELLQRYLPALRQFVRLRSDGVLRRKESASDLVQTACLQALEGISHFEYRGEHSFRNWLLGCVLNIVRDRRRYYHAGKRDVGEEATHAGRSEDDDLLAQQYATLGTPSHHAMAQERIEAFEAAFDELAEDQREVILLSRIQRLPHKEVAAHMGRSEEAVRALLSRALVKLSGLVRRDG